MARKKSNDASQTRLKILKAAIKCFGQNGVAETKMAHIAIEAKVDPPHINYYYPNFESLFKDIVDYIHLQLNETAVGSIEENISDSAKMLEHYAVSYMRWAEKNRELATMWLYFYHVTCYNTRFASLNKTVRDFGRDRISLIIYKGLETRKIKLKKGLNVQDLALAIQTVITGHVIMALTESNADFSLFQKNMLLVIQNLLK